MVQILKTLKENMFHATPLQIPELCGQQRHCGFWHWLCCLEGQTLVSLASSQEATWEGSEPVVISKQSLSGFKNKLEFQLSRNPHYFEDLSTSTANQLLISAAQPHLSMEHRTQLPHWTIPRLITHLAPLLTMHNTALKSTGVENPSFPSQPSSICIILA